MDLWKTCLLVIINQYMMMIIIDNYNIFIVNYLSIIILFQLLGQVTPVALYCTCIKLGNLQEKEISSF